MLFTRKSNEFDSEAHISFKLKPFSCSKRNAFYSHLGSTTTTMPQIIANITGLSTMFLASFFLFVSVLLDFNFVCLSRCVGTKTTEWRQQQIKEKEKTDEKKWRKKRSFCYVICVGTRYNFVSFFFSSLLVRILFSLHKQCQVNAFDLNCTLFSLHSQFWLSTGAQNEFLCIPLDFCVR